MTEKLVVGIVVVVVVALVLGGCVVQPIFVRSTSADVVATVTRLDRVTYGSGEDMTHMYLVYTADETFCNTDSLWCWKFTSSDLQGKLQPGQVYHLRVYGWRVPFLSWYRNIVSAEPVATSS